jgi:23S rRNA (adenine2503-C2)-methyltransferase
LCVRHPVSHIFEFTPESLGDWCAERGMPRFRARQVLEWVYEKGVVDPAGMTNLSKRDREVLAGAAPGDGVTFLSGRVLAERAATDGTRKRLIEWEEPGGAAARGPSPNGAGGVLPVLGASPGGAGPEGAGDPSRQTECVMIPAEDETGRVVRRTACVSSQVGCPVGCRFCASGVGGLEGNLSAGRIVEQVWRLNELLRAEAAGAAGAVGRRPARITNVVFMGMGEPLANLGAVVRAVRTLAAPWGFNISARKITISTVGLPKAIERLAEELDLPVTLALSLHAPNDELRRRLIPWAEYTTVADLLAACRRWFEKTGREVTLEYTLLRGVNDRPEHAEELAGVARTLRANVNLIRYNEVPGLAMADGSEFRRPRTEDVLEFQRILRARHVNTHIRRSRGRDIGAACGQLRHEVGAGGGVAGEAARPAAGS